MSRTYIGGIQRFSTEDGPGIRTMIFFKGCPLHCRWCHNPELIDPEYGVLYREKDCIHCGRCAASCPHGAVTMDTERNIHIDRTKCDGCGLCVNVCPALAMYTKSKEYSMEELLELVRRDQDYYEESGGGITLSGGEIMMHADHALEVGEAVKNAGYTLAIETSGYGTYSGLEALASLTDIILYDCKHMDPEKHLEYVGADNVRIQENLGKLCENAAIRKKIVIRVPLIYGVNDDEENIRNTASMMKKRGLRRIDLLPYHNMGIGKAKHAGIEQETFESPSDEHLEHLRAILLDEGLEPTVMGHED